MYITQLHDDNIYANYQNQQMYVEYAEPVALHIDKIYLSPGAAKDQDFFRILLDRDDQPSKVCISPNPFKNKG